MLFFILFYIAHTVIFSLMLIFLKFVVFSFKSSSSICTRSVDNKLHFPGTQLVFLASRGWRVLLLSLHTERSLASLFFTPLATMLFSIFSFRLFFSMSLFQPLITKLLAFTGALSSSIFSTCQTIAISALSRTLLFSPHLSFHELSPNLCYL